MIEKNDNKPNGNDDNSRENCFLSILRLSHSRHSPVNDQNEDKTLKRTIEKWSRHSLDVNLRLIQAQFSVNLRRRRWIWSVFMTTTIRSQKNSSVEM